MLTRATYTTAVPPTHAPLTQQKRLIIPLSIVLLALLSSAMFITAIILIYKKFHRSNNSSRTFQRTPTGDNGNVAEFEDHNSHNLQQITPVDDNENVTKTADHSSILVLMSDNENTAESNDHNAAQDLNHTCNEAGNDTDADESESDPFINDEKIKTQSPAKSFLRQISQFSHQLSTKSNYSELRYPSTPPSFRHSTARQSSN